MSGSLEGQKDYRGSLISRVEPWVLMGVWVLTIAVFSILRPHIFMTVANWANILASQASLVVLALGLLIPLTAGEYDVSIGSMAGFSVMVLAVLNVNGHIPLAVAALIAIVGSAIIGMFTGLITVYFGIDSLIVTLGVANVLSGMTLWISGSNTVTGVSVTLVNWTITDRLFGIPYELYAGLLLTVVMWAF